MRNAALTILGMAAASLAGVFLAGVLVAPAAARARAVREPTVVVELFTSQGCSSCVKSGDIVQAAADKPHVIALAPQAVEVFRDLHKITGKRALAFPGVRNPRVPLSENTLNAALRRLGYTADEMTAHGFRTIASTLLNESGLWNPDAIERALAHQDANAVRRAYARGEYWDERVRMAAWWADHLDELRSAPPKSTNGAEPANAAKPPAASQLDNRLGSRPRKAR